MSIILVSMPGCAPCKVIKSLMDGMGIDYEEVDARDQNDKYVAELLFRHRIKAVPALIIDGVCVGIGADAVNFVNSGGLNGEK